MGWRDVTDVKKTVKGQALCADLKVSSNDVLQRLDVDLAVI